MVTYKDTLSEYKDMIILLIALVGAVYFSWGLLSPVVFQTTTEEVVTSEARQLLQNFSETNQ